MLCISKTFKKQNIKYFRILKKKLTSIHAFRSDAQGKSFLRTKSCNCDECFKQNSLACQL